MNKLPIETLTHIFAQIPDPTAWSTVSHLFHNISRDPAAVAEWSLLRFDRWRAFDAMIGLHPRILTPHVSVCMLAKGAYLPRHLVQTVLLHPGIPGLKDETIGTLQHHAAMKYGNWEAGQNDIILLEPLCEEARTAVAEDDPAASLSDQLPIGLKTAIDELVRRTHFYPIRSSIPGHNQNFELILVTLLIYARSYMQELFRQGFSVKETSGPINAFLPILQGSDYSNARQAKCLNFLLAEKAVVVQPTEIEILLASHLQFNRFESAFDILLNTFPFSLTPLVHNALRTVLPDPTWPTTLTQPADPTIPDFLFRSMYRLHPSRTVLDEVLAARFASTPEVSDTLILSPSTLKTFLHELNWSVYSPGARYLFSLAARRMAPPSPLANEYAEIARRCVKEGFRWSESHFDLMFKQTSVADFKQFILDVVTEAKPVVVDRGDGERAISLGEFLTEWFREKIKEVEFWEAKSWPRSIPKDAVLNGRARIKEAVRTWSQFMQG